MKFYFYIPLLLLFQSCESENPCEDVDFGTQLLKSQPVSLFPYHTGERLIFKDSANHEILFYLMPNGKVVSNYNLWVEPFTEGECAGEARGKFFLQYLAATFMSDSLQIMLECSYAVGHKWIKDKPIFYDYIVCRVERSSYGPGNFGIGIGHRTDDRGNEDILKYFPEQKIFHEQLHFLDKDFENVYSAVDINGSEIHFNHTLGVIAFKSKYHGLWVLDRTE